MNRNYIIYAVIALCILFIIIMNSELINYREKELAFNLDVISKSQSDNKIIGLISRYLLIKKRIEQGEERESDYIIEAKLQMVLNSMKENIGDDENEDDETQLQDKIKIPIEGATKLYLKGIRLILGKDMPEELFRAYNDPFIELAYFYERYKKYNYALKVLTSIKDRRKNIASYTRRNILLHSGYCHAMTYETDKAIDSYQKVIDHYPRTEEAATAKILLSFLLTMSKGIEEILKQKLSIDEKAEKLYFISAYKQSANMFNKFFAKAKAGYNLSRTTKARFYRGRSFEELGDYKKAKTDYRFIIASNPRSNFARLANRRLMIIGGFYKGGKKLTEEATGNSKRLGDEKFLKKVQGLKLKMTTDKFDDVKIKAKFDTFVKNTEKVKERPPEEKDKKNILITGNLLFTPTIKVNMPDDFKNSVKRGVIDKKPAREKVAMAQIESRDGFFFEGSVLSENDETILIKTEFGNILINKKSIGSIKRYKM